MRSLTTLRHAADYCDAQGLTAAAALLRSLISCELADQSDTFFGHLFSESGSLDLLWYLVPLAYLIRFIKRAS